MRSLFEEDQLNYLTHSSVNKGLRIFPKSIGPKVNLIVRFESELEVELVNKYLTATYPSKDS